MKVWVNGKERADLARLALSEEMLATLDNEATQLGYILSEIRVDNETISRENFCALGLGDWENVSFTLVDFTDFLRETLTDAVAYAQKLTASIELFAHQLEHEIEGVSSPILSPVANITREGNVIDITPATRALQSGPIAEIIDGVNWLLGIYNRARNFTPTPLRLSEDSELETGILRTLSQLLALQFRYTLERNHAPLALAACLGGELLPQVQMLEYRVAELAKAAQMPVQ